MTTLGRPVTTTPFRVSIIQIFERFHTALSEVLPVHISIPHAQFYFIGVRCLYYESFGTNARNYVIIYWLNFQNLLHQVIVENFRKF